MALILVGGVRWCTGSLINTVCDDDRPLFLTADHCLGGWANDHIKYDAITNPVLNHWSFYWNYESPRCPNIAPPPAILSTVGATVIANNGNTDFALLQLTEDPKDRNGVTPYYLGWDRSGYAGTGGVGIHHPNGDVKKIATYIGTPTNSTCLNANYWQTGFVATSNGHSVMEPGSSGSPLINSNRHVIGQLYGPGNLAICPQHLCDNQPELQEVSYGKFSVSWTGGGAIDNRRRLRDWLDPLGTAPTTLVGKAATLISGPSTVCQQATYQIENLPEGAQINWTTSNSLSISNGQGTPQVTVSNTGVFSISHFVKATITACGSSYEIRKNISKVGNENAVILLYDADGINSYHSGTILTNYLVKAHLNNPSPDPGNYRWTIIAPPKSGIPNRLASGQTFPFSTDYSGHYTFRLTYFAECGWSTVTRDIYFGFGSLMQVKIFPNPASNETSVSLNLSSGEDLNSMSSQIWEFEVHDQNQRLITHQRNIKSNSHTINTAGWQKGLYIVTVKYNNETFSEKLVVK
ncbi:T9SS type A sorting domain-containing protein [Alkalitalea saponilacus]|uniref:Por secretion system C-terminal sorting domain-containing protein n=1 Tax=Alkalitalea saponilacus TaxID=889453 RepID=A0A1T5GPU1_9BACT|nr:T9SS type A sorting domain-containing protein [Alkalitalea saponilacus]ASB48233.1 hypothetical protein CDL62_03290 [Alkalitalea saponilacus]SKC10358.1 Por secretion system C-terminal sorting domain-containing protein [Alkalitalea saponilacus]